MHSRLKSLLCLTLTGGCSLLSAGNFASQVPAGSFIYMETRDVPGYHQRFSRTDLHRKLQSVDWNEMVIQLYKIGLAGNEDPDLTEDLPDEEEMREILGNLKSRWKELHHHLNGDAAFSVGNFQEVVTVFRLNAKIRETMALTYEVELDGEELSEEQLQQQSRRIAEESKLDMQEFNSILGQFTFRADVQDGKALEDKLYRWLKETVTSFSDGEEPADAVGPAKTIEGDFTLYSFGGEENDMPALHWAIQDGVWIITFSRESLLESLAFLSNPPADSLAGQQGYKDAVEYVGEADSFFYWDFAPLDSLIRNVLKEMPEKESEPVPFVGKLPTGTAVLDWLELDALLPYAIGSRLEEEGIRYRGRSGFTRETALSRIFIDPAGGAAEVPGFVHHNFGKFASFHWHIGEGWSRLEKELMGIAPQAAAGMGLGRMLAAGQIGFDLKLQFMDHLDGNMIFVQTFSPEVIEEMLEASQNENPAEMMKVQMEHPTGGQNYLFAMGMKNPDAIHQAFERLMTRFHPGGIPEPVLFENHELFYPIPADLQGGKFRNMVSYAYLDGYFLLALGDDQLLKDAVLAGKDPALQVRNRPAFKEMLSRVPANPMAMEYSNAEQQKKAMQVIQASLGMLKAGNPGVDIPDLSVLGELIAQTIEVSTQKGLVTEIDGWVAFPPEK